MISTPVVMIVFRRPEHTRRVLTAIREARPRRLMVIADGASGGREGEAQKCAAARGVVDELVDWPCEVLRNYSDVNLGVEARFYSGFQWVFEQCESAIILEDDEVPHASFFGFCEEMLARYREDERVFAVNGTNFVADRYTCAESYYFSRYFHCWGFATWRRAWREYDLRLSRWPEVRGTDWLMKLCDGRADEARHHAENFEKVHRGEIRTWDYQITFAMWLRGALAITPSVNLVSNSGFGRDSLHYKSGDHPFANMRTGAMGEPLRHPAEVVRDAGADREESRAVIEPWLRVQERRRRPGVMQRLRGLLRR